MSTVPKSVKINPDWDELAATPVSHLIEYRLACQQLLAGYESGDGLSDCPLCNVNITRRTNCVDCPWVTIAGRVHVPHGDYYPCTRGRSTCITSIRRNPYHHKVQRRQRINELRVWIQVYDKVIKENS